MRTYLFETDEFGLSDEGIHLLRSRFNYATIHFHQIDRLRIERAHLANHGFWLLMLGIASLLFSAFYTLVLYEVFTDDAPQHVYLEELLVPFLPLVFGLFVVRASFRKGW
ncbi:hypothetical protein SAMN05421823_112142 [Catalinimonas alkaloidigena]|uniref:Uncharacterized protein n=1 Tax=Catalinimonas alkaloidigena TaxID=1075417 RepID=A0A1G9SFD5_9BACT|nr:hypothetical protein [Catalinimonas alkaloidigena]SDM34111.1 hypothetical protein SAMN05421823_112142 [Catalinimonas alkaloidigena]